MKLRPLHDRIIVKRLEEERKSAGGIVIPDTAAEKPSMGEVIAAGPGKTDDNGKLVPMGVKVGDKILFGKYSGQEFKLEGNLHGPRFLQNARRLEHTADPLPGDRGPGAERKLRAECPLQRRPVLRAQPEHRAAMHRR